ncbi:hypothetical protein EB796_006122 [Bugula neritina]|uniref:Uncharacterized protein n=1 Tax=Bugula neritina TaxID=10212 RepID=A0A7J7KA67_BUGNE|nr:hypothetical protein EB796_006122 [Bugula neritina]
MYTYIYTSKTTRVVVTVSKRHVSRADVSVALGPQVLQEAVPPAKVGSSGHRVVLVVVVGVCRPRQLA